MKEIQLTQGQVALVDDEDFEALNRFKWYARRGVRTWYATRKVYPSGNHVHMHAQIVQTPKGVQTDHIDGNGLNNCRNNLRPVTSVQNGYNRTHKALGKSSQYVGVSWDKFNERWEAYICVDGRRRRLGRFDSEAEAARAYDKAGFARDPDHFTPNFPRPEK